MPFNAHILQQGFAALVDASSVCSQRRASEIASHTGLDEHSAAAIAAFFGKSIAPTQLPAGLGGPAQLLRSL